MAGTAGCGGVEGLSFGKPPPVLAGAGTTGDTLPGNLESIAQRPVPGATTTTLPPIGPGGASIVGTVFGPGGPVGGATVEADRFVGNQVTSLKVTTAADGSYLVGSVLGGRYRIRAWQPPTLDMTQPQIFFLGSTESRQVDLHMGAFSGPDVATSVNPDLLEIGQPANFVVQVTTPTVGTDGVVRDRPDSGVQVTLSGSSAWTVYTANPSPTGSNGQVLFQISCSSTGSNPLSVQVGSGGAQNAQVPDCVEPPSPTTQCTPSSTGSGGTGNTSSTTQPSGSNC